PHPAPCGESQARGPRRAPVAGRSTAGADWYDANSTSEGGIHMLDSIARSRATLFALPLAAFAVGCGGSDSQPATTAADDSEKTAGVTKPGEPVATTRYGQVRGTVRDGILAFKGIRYGADTATTRFAAPAPP